MPKTRRQSETSKFLFLPADPYLGQPNMAVVNEPEDELEQLERQDYKRKIREIRKTEADLYLKQREHELKKLQSQTDPAMGNASSPAADDMVKALISDPAVQKRWLEYSDEQRNVILAGISAMRASQGGSTQGMSLLFPLMMMQMQSKPSTSIKEMVDVINAVRPAQNQNMGMKDFVDAVKAVSPNQGQGEIFKTVIELLQPMYQNLSQKDQQVFSSQMENLKSQIVNPLQYLKEVQEAGSSLGLARQSDPNMMLEIEKIRGDREMKIEEMRTTRESADRNFQLEMEKWRLERMDKKEGDKQKMDMLNNLLTGPIGKVVQDFGSAGASRIGKIQPQQPQQAGPQSQVQMGQCPNCGGTFPIKPDATKVTCPHCQKDLVSEPAVHEQPAQNPPEAES